jgi:hypothetical protein
MYLDSLSEGLSLYGNTLIAAHFEGQYAATARWPNLSPGYAVRKNRRNPNQPMLVDTGALKRSIVGKFKLTPNERLLSVKLAFNEALDRGAWLETGAFNGSMGPRPWSEPSDSDKKKMQDKLQRTLNDKMVAASNKNK